MSGAGVTDPQTAQERVGRDQRVAGSGVTGATGPEREANYQAYLRLLNNTEAQLASGAVHDHLNELGVTVVSGNGTRMRVGGDDTLLTKSDRLGAEQAAQAAQLSRQAVDELMRSGRTSITTEQIFAFVPVSVVPDGGAPVALEQWQNTALRRLCFETVFPEYYRRFSTMGTEFVSRQAVSGGISPDVTR